jgi:hypothetical protein
LLSRGLAATAGLWPEIEVAYGWVHQAAHLLGNHDGQDAAGVRVAYTALLDEMTQRRGEAGTLGPAIDHFLQVTRSYWPGLFHCYDVPDLPRTNNDLEQFFGAARYHERRTTGRKTASPALVVRGSVRVIAAVATRQHPFRATDLCPRDRARWQELRQALEYRHEARRAQRRFRTDPAAYLAALEDQLLRSGLPA